MKLGERINLLNQLFIKLENTSSRNDKESLVQSARSMDKQLNDDIDFAFEILTGKIKAGFTFEVTSTKFKHKCEWHLNSEESLRTFLQPIYTASSKSESAVACICNFYTDVEVFVRALVNREWRLGIGNSQIAKTVISPMLAKKFDPEKRPNGLEIEGYYVTQKLDGNRCISIFEDGEWHYYSRSGKRMKVSFDMSLLPEEYVYDGEILSIEQLNNPNQRNFNALSGLINSNEEDKSKLVYVIFDVPNISKSYSSRRNFLNSLKNSNNVKILPVLKKYKTWKELCDNVYEDLENITSIGGEGVMINTGFAMYQQKRTDYLLKLKKVQTMDMRVIAYELGTGKNVGVIGSLVCNALSAEGDKVFNCKVGSGLNDYQRQHWAEHPEKIIGKIVEVSYFSVSQSSQNLTSKFYSLRFPRLKRVREDKNETSIY